MQKVRTKRTGSEEQSRAERKRSPDQGERMDGIRQGYIEAKKEGRIDARVEGWREGGGAACAPPPPPPQSHAPNYSLLLSGLELRALRAELLLFLCILPATHAHAQR